MKSNRNSNPQYKGEQGNKDEATKTVQLVSGSRQTGRRGAEGTPPTRRCQRHPGREVGFKGALPANGRQAGNESARRGNAVIVFIADWNRGGV